jgi:hypothetical protein
MKNIIRIFHIISYLQYPLIVVAVWFYIPFVVSLSRGDADWTKLNYSLIFFGITVSFAALQDTKKTSLKFEKRIWKNPKKGKIAIIAIAFLVFSLLTFGIFGYFLASNTIFQEVSFGIIVLGIGFIGILKSAIEVYENHRETKNTTNGKKESIGVD